jgi:Holliday junction resolvase RusA-like endonuclease
MTTSIAFRILGSPQSKANSRRIVVIGGRPSSIKSKAAVSYENDALRQIPSWARVRMEGPVCVTLKIFYSSERPDLDESIVLDVLQDRFKKVGDQRVLIQSGVYRNDRQVRRKFIYHGVDKHNPRTEVLIEPLQAQQADMLAPDIGTMLKPLPEAVQF